MDTDSIESYTSDCEFPSGKEIWRSADVTTPEMPNEKESSTPSETVKKGTILVFKYNIILNFQYT